MNIVRIVEERVLRRISQEFPDEKWSSVQIKDEGWDHFVAILDNSVVFRLPKTEQKYGYFENEIALLELVARHTRVRVPTITHVSLDKTITAHSFLPGDQLDAETVALFGPDLLRTVSEQIAQFLSDIHDLSFENCLGRCHSDRNPKDGLEWLRKGYLKHLQRRLTEGDCAIIENFFTELESSISSCSEEVLLHADLGLEHVLLVRERKKISIIDFSDWGFGDPAFDFCGLYDFPPLAREVFRHYRHAENFGDMLARAEVYNRRIPIAMMIDSLSGYPCGFDESYQKFKRLFRTEGTDHS